MLDPAVGAFQLTRHPANPILAPDPALAWEAEGVFNPGVAQVGDETYLLYRAVGERESYVSHLGLATSRDGVAFKRAFDHPVFGPHQTYDQWATEDPRITKIGDDYYVTYVAVPGRIMEHGRPTPRLQPLETTTALLRTRDFRRFEPLGVISPPDSDNKDIVLFPRKIGGRYAMLHRPNRWTRGRFSGAPAGTVPPCPVEEMPAIPGVWLAWSEDLRHWGDHHLLMSPTHAADTKIGPGLPPLETEDGWLIIYHHVAEGSTPVDFEYTARVALFDRDDPSRLIARLRPDILVPEAPYETEGGTRIVFPTGGFIAGDTLHVYYGASDRYVCLATGSVGELLAALRAAPPAGP